MRSMVLFVGIIIVCGCGSNGRDGVRGPQGDRGEQGPPGAKGEAGPAGKDSSGMATTGSRIKAKWLVGEDGSRQFVGWHDVLIGADCSFQLASDDMPRCLPANKSGFPVFFTEGSCSKAVAVFEKNQPCSYTDYVTTPTAAGAACVIKFASYKVGAPLVMPPQLYYLVGGACTPAPTPAADLFTAGDPLDPSTFVAATSEIDP